MKRNNNGSQDNSEKQSEDLPKEQKLVLSTDADRFIKIGYNKKTKSATIQKTDIHFVPDIRSEVILCAHLLSL